MTFPSILKLLGTDKERKVSVRYSQYRKDAMGTSPVPRDCRGPARIKRSRYVGLLVSLRYVRYYGSGERGEAVPGDTVARWSALTGLDPELSADSDDEVDPRWLRSRTRLLDAAVELLRTGGIDAVTIDAVTKASKVARTTLYRHFGCSSDLRAATLERLLPPLTPPPSTGSLQDRLVELVCGQATLYKEASLHPTTLAWIALRVQR